MLKEFKKFAMKGNVVDMAIGVILGGAFGKIVSSLVQDIIMPPLGLLLGEVDFSNFYINLSGTHYSSLAAAKVAGAPTINYGIFINTTIDFLIIALTIFLILRKLLRVNTAQTHPCPECLSEIPKLAKRCRYCACALAEVSKS